MTVSEDFTSLTGRFRGELLAHCYRMLGSAEEAEDLVQETYLRAWRSFDGFEGRSSVRTWLYRIATNVCLTAIERRGRRPLPSGLGGPAQDAGRRWWRGRRCRGCSRFRTRCWPGSGEDPAAVAVSRAGIRLAFVAALQYLSARQRAVLILRDVLEWPAAQVADLLGTTTTAVNSGAAAGPGPAGGRRCPPKTSWPSPPSRTGGRCWTGSPRPSRTPTRARWPSCCGRMSRWRCPRC